MSQPRPHQPLASDNTKLIDATPLDSTPIEPDKSNNSKSKDDEEGEENNIKDHQNTSKSEVKEVRETYPVNLRHLLATKWACNMCDLKFRSKIALKKHKSESHSY